MAVHHRYSHRPVSLLAIAALCTVVAPAPADAQTLSVRIQCTNHGATAVEPTGEGDSQSVLAAQATCVVQGGPMDGAVETQHNLWRYDKGTGTLLSGHSIARKPGALSAAQILQGTQTLQMTDGRVTGWSASGRARTIMAAGSAAPLANRTLSWTATPTGPRSYIIQVSYDP